MHLSLNVSSSVHNCGGVVDGGNAMAAIRVLLLLQLLWTPGSILHVHSEVWTPRVNITQYNMDPQVNITQ